MSQRIGDLTQTTSVAWNDLLEKETDAFGASNKINIADFRTGVFAGGSGFSNNDPLVVGPITVNTNKFLVDVSGNITVAGTSSFAGATTHNAAVTINAGLTISGAVVATNPVHQIVPTTGTSKMYWEMVNTGNTVRFGSEGSAGGEVLTGASAYSLVINSVTAGRALQLGTENTIRMTIRNTGIVDFSGAVTLPTTVQLYLDGGGDTYLRESAANTIEFVTGGSQRLTIANAGITALISMTGTNFTAGSGNFFGFSGRSLITSPADGSVTFTPNAGLGAGSVLLQLGNTDGTAPAIKRNGAAINFRTAADGADVNITAADILSSTSIKSNSSSAGIGYATGAGGSVTQVTSRTTAVTINKICGQITTFSDGTSPTGASFLVNNSTVGDKDTIVLSAANDPSIALVTLGAWAVTNGSFKISYTWASGFSAATVINFTVLKGVVA